eukprot:gene12351-14484_t
MLVQRKQHISCDLPTRASHAVRHCGETNLLMSNLRKIARKVQCRHMNAISVPNKKRKINRKHQETCPCNTTESLMPYTTEFIEDDGFDPTRGIHDDSLKQVPTGRLDKFKFYFSLSSYWFAYAVVMASLTSLVWPSQIASIVGQELKYKYTSILPIFGIVISVCTAPLAGALSDHSKSQYGRRKLFIFSGSIIAALSLYASSIPKHNIYVFIACIMGVQFGINWGGGPFTGLMPDIVPREKFGAASGHLALANALGNLVGLLGSGVISMKTVHQPVDQTSPPASYLAVYLFLAITFALFAMPTVFFVKERPQTGFVPKFTMIRFFKSFYLPRDRYLNFYWVIITRFFQEMGIYSVLPFFQFYLQDVVKVDEPEFYSSMMLSLIIITSVPASVIAGPLSDKYGRKPLVYVSSGIMAVCTLGFLLLSWRPSLLLVMISAGLFGLGYGAYQSVDWALALDVLPDAADIAKDMGLWHQSMIIPQVFAPLISGLVIDYCKKNSTVVIGYVVVFAITDVWFFLATIMIRPIQIHKRDNFIQLEQSITSIDSSSNSVGNFSHSS